MSDPVLLRSPSGRPELVWPVARDHSGRDGPTKAQAQGHRWRRTSRGLYLPSSIELSVEQRILEAAAVLPPHGAVTGWAALHWLGARRWFEGFTAAGEPRPVWLVTAGEDIRPQPGIEISAERLDPRDVSSVHDVQVTSAVRSVWFEMRYAAGEREAAKVASMACFHDVVSVDEIATYTALHNGWTGSPQCRSALAYAEENCWSPTEFDTVIVWQLDAGLPRPLCNQPVFDRSGRHVGTPDLLDVEAGLVVEYEGSVHLTGRRRRRDVQREERFRDAGLEYLTMLGSDLHDTDATVRRLLAARARARFAAETTRPWTIEHPPDWPPTRTVEQRRALEGGERVWLLQYRAA